MVTLAINSTGKAGKPSAYQLQATGRAKRATRQVAVVDTRIRAAVRVLADALKLGDTARASVEAVNKTYGTDYPTSSKFAEMMAESGISEGLAKAAEAAPTTEFPPLVSLVNDSPDGAALPGQAVFWEYEAPTNVMTEKTATAKPGNQETLTEPVAA